MIKPEVIEERRYQLSPVEIEERAEGGMPLIKGTPIVFGVESNDLGGFTEMVDPAAWTDADISDVLAVVEHDEDSLLARSDNGTLRMIATRTGVLVEIDPIDTTDGMDAVKLVRRKDIKGMSFKFSTKEDRWENRADGSVLRTILKFKKIYDVSLVARPAYPQTEVALRSLSSWQESRMVMKPNERQSDAPFDEKFLTEMITHHQMGVEMATEAVAKAENDEVKALAGGIIEKQLGEIDTMQDLLSTLYGLPDPDGKRSLSTSAPNPPPTPAPEGDPLAWYKAKNKSHRNSLLSC